MLTLTTNARVISLTDLQKRTTIEWFKNLQVDDIIYFYIPLKAVGYGSHGTYAAYVNCLNERTGDKYALSFNEIRKLNNYCELEEIKE